MLFNKDLLLLFTCNGGEDGEEMLLQVCNITGNKPGWLSPEEQDREPLSRLQWSWVTREMVYLAPY